MTCVVEKADASGDQPRDALQTTLPPFLPITHTTTSYVSAAALHHLEGYPIQSLNMAL